MPTDRRRFPRRKRGLRDGGRWELARKGERPTGGTTKRGPATMSTGVGRRIADLSGPVVPARLAGTQLGPALPFSRAAPPQSSPQQEAEEKAAAFPEDPGQHSEQTAPAGPHTRMVPRAPSATKAERREASRRSRTQAQRTAFRAHELERQWLRAASLRPYTSSRTAAPRAVCRPISSAGREAGALMNEGKDDPLPPDSGDEVSLKEWMLEQFGPDHPLTRPLTADEEERKRRREQLEQQRSDFLRSWSQLLEPDVEEARTAFSTTTMASRTN